MNPPALAVGSVNTYDTMEEAAEAVGSDMDVPEMLEGFDTREIQCSESGMLEVIYRNADGGTPAVRSISLQLPLNRRRVVSAIELP